MYSLEADINSNQPKIVKENKGIEKKLKLNTNWLGTYNV
jgi:hypothetical protein